VGRSRRGLRLRQSRKHAQRLVSTDRAATRATVVGDVSFAVGVTVVPVSTAGPLWLLSTVVAAACLGTRSGARSAVLVAYAIPAVVGAPWPAHCLAGTAVWLLQVHRSNGIAPLRKRHTSLRPRVVVPGLLVLGAAAGGAAVVIDRERIFGGGFVFALQSPSPAVLAVVVIGLAVVNAIAEEVFWREVVDHTLAQNSITPRYLFQAFTFGLGHWGGIPHGLTGAVASGVFSAIVYRVRRRWGLLGGIVVHIATDLVIFWFVAQHAVYAWTGFTWAPIS
jgi:membrane protease YdiL (CAAX protease family)